MCRPRSRGAPVPRPIPIPRPIPEPCWKLVEEKGVEKSSERDINHSIEYSELGEKEKEFVFNYLEESFVEKGVISIDGERFARALLEEARKLGIDFANMTVDPDFMFGFILSGVYTRGFAARLEYLNLEPRCLRWFRRGSHTVAEAGLVYSSRADLRFVRQVHLDRVCSISPSEFPRTT